MTGKERPPVPDIPGLYKGKVEAQRELWASRMRAGFAERIADLLVIAKEDEGFLKLPVLGISEKPEAPNQPLWKPRVNLSSGEIYTTRWQKVTEAEPSEFVVFGGKKKDRLLPSTPYPQSWEVARIIPQKLPTIEAAMRQQDEIAHDMGVSAGVEQRRVEEMLMALNSISQAFFSSHDISLRQLEGLGRQAESLLRQHGLLSARDSVWKKISGYTLRAASPDSLGRVNPLVSRVLARAAYLGATERELIQRASREKADKIFFYLAVVRGNTRFRIESAELVLGRMGGFGYGRPTAALSGEVRWIPARDALIIENSVRTLVDDILKPILPAPYVHASRMAEAILIGKAYKSNREARDFEASLDSEGKRQFRRRSAVEYLRERDAVSAKKRMEQTFKVLHESISNPDNQETRVFD